MRRLAQRALKQSVLDLKIGEAGEDQIVRGHDG
jgi:hypothetical protein